MEYQVIQERGGPSEPVNGTCFLVRNAWDDFGFKTLFEVVLFDEVGTRYDLGTVRIIRDGMGTGNVEMPEGLFRSLDDRYCSIGSSRDYYLEVSKLPVHLRTSHLKALYDGVAYPEVFDRFRGQRALRASLLRDVSIRDVTHNFPRILHGYADPTPYSFQYEFPSEPGGPGTERCVFQVIPDSRPPTNIHVLIGRNGVGKTRLLAGMADHLMENDLGQIGIRGQFIFDTEEARQGEFLNLVIVSFSAFDRFDPIPTGAQERTETTMPYFYVGIKAVDPQGHAADRARIKSPAELDNEFAQSMRNVASDQLRLGRWLSAMRIVSSDPGIGDFNVHELFSKERASGPDEMIAAFSQMSSGHKIVLLTLTRLVENVSDRSLVLIDEPETHLHPPLLGSFVRALSNLLVSRNAVAIVATHSPVVLQEVPASCVSLLMRSGASLRILSPDDETFAENVSVLTRKVFGLEVEQSGFYKLLRETARDEDYDGVLQRFAQQIGSEGRALTRAFVARED